MLRASGTARPMTERPDEHRLLAQYLAEIQKKPLLTHAQELALGEQKNAGAQARQPLISGSCATREEGLALAERRRTDDQAHTALVEGHLRSVVTHAGACDRHRGSKSFLWANLEEILVTRETEPSFSASEVSSHVFLKIAASGWIGHRKSIEH